MRAARLTPPLSVAGGHRLLRLLWPIAPTLDSEVREAPAPRASAGWITALGLVGAVALMLIAAGDAAGRTDHPLASWLYWAGIVLMVLPPAARIASPGIARGERLFLLLLLAESFFLVKLFYAPTGLVQYDEFLHWITAQDILDHRQLFLPNSLLPISAYYPGLEIVTTAVANLVGVAVFPASIIVVAVLRGTFIIALYLFFERLSGSSRLAALSSLIYMGSSTFAMFDAAFGYETLGLTLLALVLCTETDEDGHQQAWRLIALLGLLISALAMTHHLSMLWCSSYLIALSAIDYLRSDPLRDRSRSRLLHIATALSIVVPLLWIVAMRVPIMDYLGPIAMRSIGDIMDKLHGHSQPRELFVASDGTVQPIGYRLVGIGATLLLSLGLATGFFRSLALAVKKNATRSGWPRLARVLRRRWDDSHIVLLTLGAFGFPVSVVLRLSGFGWEIGNRMNSVVFVAVGFVCSAGIVYFWQSRMTAPRLWGMAAAIGVVLVGSITTGSGVRAPAGPYRVSADAESIEPMGIATAKWTRQWLGDGNAFAADRTNQILLGTYGQQNVVTSLDTGIDESRIYLNPRLSGDALYPIRRGKIDYLLTDLRLTTAPPVLGHNFEDTERDAGKAPPPAWLLKFDNAPWAGRIFDNGWIVIYDVSALHGRR